MMSAIFERRRRRCFELISRSISRQSWRIASFYCRRVYAFAINFQKEYLRNKQLNNNNKKILPPQKKQR